MEDNFDAILTTVGTGKWTIFYVFVLMYWYSALPYNTIAGVFIAPPINHTCIPPPSSITLIYDHHTHENTSYSLAPDQAADDACSYLAEDVTTGHQKQQPCNDWHFDNSTFISTLTSEFQLVCDRQHYRATYQSMYMLGMLVGAIFNGFLTDKYGRWKMLVISTVVYTVIGLGSAWLPSLSCILAARFLLGIMHPSILQSGHILVLEVTELKMRTTFGIIQITTWSIATMLFSGWAYVIRDWRWLQTAVSLPNLLFLPLMGVVGESPRWLAVVGQHQRALKELKRAAKWNRVTLPPDHQLLAIMHSVQQQAATDNNNVTEANSTTLDRAFKEILILFKTRKLQIITVVTCFLCFVVALLFFGLTAGASTLRVDPFVYLAISGAAELPSSTIIIPFVAYFGRKKMLIFSYLFCAVVLLTQAALPHDLKWVSVTLVMLGKMSCSTAFSVVALFALELYPTEIRTRGTAATMASSRIGAIVAPFIMDSLMEKYPWAVSVVFGVASLFAGVAVWPLSESTGTKLPDTILELEGRDKDKSDSSKPTSSN